MYVIELESIPNSSERQLAVDRPPDQCPLCHRGIEAVRFPGEWWLGDGDKLVVVFGCPRIACGQPFFAYYRRSLGYDMRDQGHLEHTAPQSPSRPVVDEHVAELSPRFVRIYTEAKAAKQLDLLEVAGPGFRKALEFLIRDYWIARAEEDGERDAIRKERLSDTIKRFPETDLVREAAEGAAWVGNDETHYTRLWEDKDLANLEEYIQLTMHHLDALLSSEILRREKEEQRERVAAARVKDSG